MDKITKQTYFFSPQVKLNASNIVTMLDVMLLGGKGKNLAEMCTIGIPIPPGFILTTAACKQYYDIGYVLSDEMVSAISNDMTKLELETKKIFGSDTNPLLVSVRSGAPVSMPGMMDTILNIGLNDKTVVALATATGDEFFAYDSYRRLIQMYGNVVLNIDIVLFEKILHDCTEVNNMHDHLMMEIISKYKELVFEETGSEFPQDIKLQLHSSIEAVFKSWHGERARVYRNRNGISHDLYTAANIQSMVFGNAGKDSLTGVLFTRNPIDGENAIFGEFLPNAQGEDVVSGFHNTYPLTKADAIRVGAEVDVSMEVSMPDVFGQLKVIAKKLERHYCDMQDIEFTVEKGSLWILQTRNGKRSGNAAAKVAVDMVNEGFVTEEQALHNIDSHTLEQILYPQLDATRSDVPIASGLAASPGAASGAIVFTPQKAETLAKHTKVILVRNETSPEDIAGMYAAQGIVTGRGGVTSHAAVVARGMGKPCVCSVRNMVIVDGQTVLIGNQQFNEGDIITINGTTGEIFIGAIPMTTSQVSPELEMLFSWMDKYARMAVFANAETEHDVRAAIELGAAGIGLCRTEHMFFAPERINDVRQMILADDLSVREKILEKLSKYQQMDFEKLFDILNGKPICIRLLDPPLHEFLPHSDADIKNFCHNTNVGVEKIKTEIARLEEYNPMLGHRGCRLAVTYPEIYVAQSNAIFSAMAESIVKDTNIPCVEIMVPLVMTCGEISFVKNIVENSRTVTASKYGIESDVLQYKFGTMIELPRAIMIADKIATLVDFISFGTNDLTQTTLGLSRDDSSKFLPEYVITGLLDSDPFVTIDKDGVGVLIKEAVHKIRKVNKLIKIGVCGEHGGDPKSIEFFHEIGVDYVSCSPYRIPVARLVVT